MNGIVAFGHWRWVIGFISPSAYLGPGNILSRQQRVSRVRVTSPVIRPKGTSFLPSATRSFRHMPSSSTAAESAPASSIACASSAFRCMISNLARKPTVSPSARSRPAKLKTFVTERPVSPTVADLQFRLKLEPQFGRAFTICARGNRGSCQGCSLPENLN
jgi:hypothetical protein